jgi:hypothetical protein
MPVSSSAFSGRPPQPSCRMRSRMSRIRISPLRHVGLVDHPLLAAALAHDPQEPRRERAQRFVQGLRAGGQWVVAVAAPVATRDRPCWHQDRYPGSIGAFNGMGSSSRSLH